MFNLRGLRWPDDRDGLCALDTSFTTAHVYRVVATATAFILQEATVSPPLRKAYDLAGEVELFPTFDHVVIAERDAQVAGVAALQHDAADRRALLRHLYVGRAYRGQGIGRALMEAMVACAAHTSILRRGKAPPRDTEFGHKVWLAEVNGGPGSAPPNASAMASKGGSANCAARFLVCSKSG